MLTINADGQAGSKVAGGSAGQEESDTNRGKGVAAGARNRDHSCRPWLICHCVPQKEGPALVLWVYTSEKALSSSRH